MVFYVEQVTEMVGGGLVLAVEAMDGLYTPLPRRMLACMHGDGAPCLEAPCTRLVTASAYVHEYVLPYPQVLIMNNAAAGIHTCSDDIPRKNGVSPTTYTRMYVCIILYL